MILMQKNSRNYELLCQELISLYNIFEEFGSASGKESLDDDDKAVYEEVLARMETVIKQNINEIVKSKDFLKFAYQLRMEDQEDDKYTKAFLKDADINPEINYDIVLSNYWNKQLKRMKQRDETYFNILDSRGNTLKHSLTNPNDALFI